MFKIKILKIFNFTFITHDQKFQKIFFYELFIFYIYIYASTIVIQIYKLVTTGVWNLVHYCNL